MSSANTNTDPKRDTLVEVEGVDQTRADSVAGPNNFQYISNVIPFDEERRRVFGKRTHGFLDSAVLNMSLGPGNTLLVQTRDGLRIEAIS